MAVPTIAVCNASCVPAARAASILLMAVVSWRIFRQPGATEPVSVRRSTNYSLLEASLSPIQAAASGLSLHNGGGGDESYARSRFLSSC